MATVAFVLLVVLAIGFRLLWMAPLAVKSHLPKGLQRWLLDQRDVKKTS